MVIEGDPFSKRSRSRSRSQSPSFMDSTVPIDPHIHGEVSNLKKLKQTQVAHADALISPTTVSKSIEGVDALKTSTSGSNDSLIINGLSSDLSYHDDDGDYDEDVDDGDTPDYDDDEYDCFSYEDEYSNLQDQFDNVDLPPGVEALVPWLKEPTPTPSVTAPAGTSSSCVPQQVQFAQQAQQVQVAQSKVTNAASTSSSAGTAKSSSSEIEEARADDDEVQRRYQNFKRFDTVEDFSDHYYNRGGSSGGQPSKTWLKKIQEEWIILEKDLPDTIFVRVYEARMDLLRAVIVGAAGTPYHDGLFVFDVLFPANYPSVPPMVYYYSGGLRLNPNLYDCGKVCLSLLNTWSGKKDEMWNPKKSTMLQVLVSIQGLILNADPFFNEPGYESMYGGVEGRAKSKKYNEEAFILSLKTMMYTIRRPPKYFEDLVAVHFLSRAHNILAACKAYIDGAPICSATMEIEQNVNVPAEFKSSLAKMMNLLITCFTKNGSKDCEKFRLPA